MNKLAEQGLFGATPFAGKGARVLVIDDDPAQRTLIERALGSGYYCTPAGNAAEARELMAQHPYELIFCDLEMPGESGLELAATLPATQRDAALIMVTATDDVRTAEAALLIGAYGYIVKPYRVIELVINARNALRRRELEIAEREHRGQLEERLVDSATRLNATVSELEGSRLEMIHRLSLAIEARDRVTAEHVEGMASTVERFALLLGCNQVEARTLGAASMMHDVGKIGVPDEILLKPGPLEPEERAVMETHAEIGHQILHGSENPLLQLGAEIAWAHHERVDGAGYPRKLTGDDIPRSALIVQIVDVYSALTSDRPYRKAMPIGEALEIIESGVGSQFDKDLGQIFLDRFKTVADPMV